LRESQAAQSAAGGKIDLGVFEQAYEQLARTFDPKEGGFGTAPKFPRPVTLNFLTCLYARNPNSEDGKHALEMVLFTLHKMAAGGMHDHLGGGFHRYSVDRYWHVPHFEKMLYDQAQLALAYLDAYQITQHRQYAQVARDILEYVFRDLTSPEGGFFSAEDADSLFEHGKPEHGEGAFYVWSEKQINEALRDAAELFNFQYGVQAHGNAPEGSDPQDEFRGKNILIARHAISETAQHFGKTEHEARDLLARSHEKLMSVRNQRPRPHRDDKIIAAWNGLMISAYARAAQVLNDPRYLGTAARAAQFIRQRLYDASAKILYRTYRDGRSDIEGFADDYAFVIQGLIDLYEASFEIEWLKFAVELQETQDCFFFDAEHGGYFGTSGKESSVPLRLKDDNDSAEPAASSIAALNLLRLAQFCNDEALAERGRKTIDAFAATLSHFASAMPQMLVALDFSLSKPRQIVIAGKSDDERTQLLLKEVHRRFIPNKILMLADRGEGQSYLGEKTEAIRAMSPIDSKPAAYVCENFTCQAAVTEPEELGKVLAK
ncbi:MAG TPA: hypothetical protein VE758_01940, partial [Chthoniobacterales bacterium]|nr:hypothetical protein [Chthoniobacterales bacterium]